MHPKGHTGENPDVASYLLEKREKSKEKGDHERMRKNAS